MAAVFFRGVSLALCALLLGGCVAKYKPDLSGKPSAKFFIDGSKTRDPWFAGVAISTDVYSYKSCKDFTFLGRIKGKDGKLNGPFAIPAGQRMHMIFIHFLDYGQNGSVQTDYPFTFVPQAGAEYAVSLDTMEKGFRDFNVVRRLPGGKTQEVAVNSWKTKCAAAGG